MMKEVEDKVIGMVSPPRETVLATLPHQHPFGVVISYGTTLKNSLRPYLLSNHVVGLPRACQCYTILYRFHRGGGPLYLYMIVSSPRFRRRYTLFV
jgi:hypothetical protein